MTVMEQIDREDCERAGRLDQYESLRRAGNSSSVAAMLALQKPPGSSFSDRAFQENRIVNHGLGDLPEWMRDKVVDRAKRAGISIAGKVYEPRLADRRGPGDPMAWVSDLGDVVKASQIKGKRVGTAGCDRTVYQPPQAPPQEDVPLAEDIIQSNMQEYLQRDPGRAKDLTELREEIVETHGAPAAKKAAKRKE